MSERVATLGDRATHPGFISTACERHYADNGQLIARGNDIFNCLIHGPNPIVGNLSPKVEIEGRMAARHGSTATCGASIIASATSPEV